MALTPLNENLFQEGIKIKILSNGPFRRSAINESKIEYVDLNANPIQGCSHACRYCYARKIDLRFKKVESEEAWHSPKIFNNFFENLKNELEKGKIDPNREIFLSTMTDLYQPLAVRNQVGRKLILLLQSYDCKYRILTKSTRILADIDILEYEKGKVGLSITTNNSNEEEKKYWEPKTPNIKSRLETLQKFAENGNIPLWVSAEPFLPRTDFKQYYDEIIKYSGENLREVVIGKMNYEVGIDQLFDWREVVNISEQYRKKYLKKIRFHYKREFWNYLKKVKLTPVDLKLGKNTDYCISI